MSSMRVSHPKLLVRLKCIIKRTQSGYQIFLVSCVDEEVKFEIAMFHSSSHTGVEFLKI